MVSHAVVTAVVTVFWMAVARASHRQVGGKRSLPLSQPQGLAEEAHEGVGVRPHNAEPQHLEDEALHPQQIRPLRALPIQQGFRVINIGISGFMS